MRPIPPTLPLLCAIAISSLGLSTPLSAEPLLMVFDEYMQRCMQTYGDDSVTEKVCESQYRAIEEKEQALTAQTDALTESLWQSEAPLSAEGRPEGNSNNTDQ
ncbi:hypothetical protein L4C36_13020 [Photobacterium japonica]|uniref:hypothetical protein n=1 Tax=Photobacterium japonica TaxID=2910235 RepID=UPI003D0B65CB